MNRIAFQINGVKKSVGSEVSSDVSLLEYLRETEGLTGTKYMCREGGCGACVVAVTKKPGAPVTSVNACLVSVMSCCDWAVTTIENLGSKQTGYHELQTELAHNNGSQCGHCSPGWVMAMYSLLKSNPRITMAEVEKSFGSNICRCTGYRPILDAFKKFASDAPAADRIMDIEDLRICEKSGRRCRDTSCDDSEWCVVDQRDLTRDELVTVALKDGKMWYKARTIEQIFEVMPYSDDYMLVAGNTAKGAYPVTRLPNVLIDISDVEKLRGYLTDQNLVVGAGHTLTELMKICLEAAQLDGFHYLEKFHNHLELVAHIPVRNLGSIAGNLMMKHQHQEFQSDVFLLLASVGAQISVRDRNNRKKLLTMEEFLEQGMNQKLIVDVFFPPLGHQYKVLTYKIMPRAQNAHAIVNAGFTYKLNSDNYVEDAIITFGGIAPKFVRAKLAERFLIGRRLFTNETLQGAIKLLKMELVPEERLPEPSGEYRQQLAIGLFYKSVLSLSPAGAAHARLASGATELRHSRPVSRGEQTFHTDPSSYPLNQPMPKIEALIQCSGKAKYTDDVKPKHDEVSAALVVSTVGRGRIASIDASVAMAIPGVIAFYKASDLPRENNSVPIPDANGISFAKEVFARRDVKYFDQALGVMIADTHDTANRASKLVRVEYTDIQRPVMEIDEAKLDEKRLFKIPINSATDRGLDVFTRITGTFRCKGQCHFPMETILCRAEPTEFGLEVYPVTQWMEHAHGAIQQALGLHQNRIDVIAKRIGGGFGLKAQATTQPAVACSLAALKLQRACRLVLPLDALMRTAGKRTSDSLEYEIEVDETGRIQHVKYTVYTDFGAVYDEVATLANLLYVDFFNVYLRERFDATGYAVLTDKPPNTTCRGPGTLEAIAFAELMLERVATELSLDPLEVRLTNIDDDKYGEIKPMIERLRTDSDYDKRRKAVDNFNLANRWKKRGIRFSLAKVTLVKRLVTQNVNVSIFAFDGSVSILHGGIDLGQGLNTKAVQTAAAMLGVPVDFVQVKTSNSNVAPNSAASGGSVSSISVVLGVEKACKVLLERLEPIRASLPDGTEWIKLIKAAYAANIDLQGHSFISTADGHETNIFGVAVSEVEVDVLTGEMQIVRVDLLQDAGRSINPSLDVGQIEGAFVMGAGYWTSEELVYSGAGELRTDRSWTYKVPQALDIPNDFRIYFRDDSVNEHYLGAKAVGEPPICLAVSVPLAMREAISAARLDAGIPSNSWFDVDGPFTVEKTLLMAATRTEDFILY